MSVPIGMFGDIDGSILQFSFHNESLCYPCLFYPFWAISFFTYWFFTILIIFIIIICLYFFFYLHFTFLITNFYWIPFFFVDFKLYLFFVRPRFYLIRFLCDFFADHRQTTNHTEDRFPEANVNRNLKYKKYKNEIPLKASSHLWRQPFWN